MSLAELLELPTGTFNNDDFVNVASIFSEEHQDRDREVAALELALRSPMVDEMVDYSQFYPDVMGAYLWKGDGETALRWAVTYVAANAQHDLDNLLAAWRELGSSGLEAGQPKRFWGDVRVWLNATPATGGITILWRWFFRG